MHHFAESLTSTTEPADSGVTERKVCTSAISLDARKHPLPEAALSAADVTDQAATLTQRFTAAPCNAMTPPIAQSAIRPTRAAHRAIHPAIPATAAAPAATNQGNNMKRFFTIPNACIFVAAVFMLFFLSVAAHARAGGGSSVGRSSPSPSFSRPAPSYSTPR